MKDRKSHAYDSHGVSATELREELEAAKEMIKLLQGKVRVFERGFEAACEGLRASAMKAAIGPHDD